MVSTATVTRTYVYTLRLTDPTAVEAVAHEFQEYGPPIIDRGDSSVSWRATGDEVALDTARALMVDLPHEWSLTIGLGVHRRTVEHP